MPRINIKNAKLGVQDAVTGKVIHVYNLKEKLITAKIDFTTTSDPYYADGKQVLIVDSGITDVKLELGLMDFPQDVQDAVFNIIKVGSMRKYPQRIPSKYVTLEFESDEADGTTRILGLYKGKLSIPSFDGKTAEKTTQIQTETVVGQFISVGDGLDASPFVKDNTSDPLYSRDAFETELYGSTIALINDPA